MGKYFEDSFWQHLVIDRVNRYGIVDEPLYFYRQRGDSISGQPSNRLTDLLEGNKMRLDFIRGKYPDLLTLMQKKYSELNNQVNPPDNVSYRCKRFFQRVKGRLCPSSYHRINL